MQRRKIYGLESKTKLHADLDAMTVEEFKKSPADMLGKLQKFILKFGPENGSFPFGIVIKIQRKINAFKTHFSASEHHAWLLLLEIMLVERLDRIRNKVGKLEELFTKLHQEHPNYARAYNYHASFLLKEHFYVQCKQLLEPVLEQPFFKGKRNNKQQKLAKQCLSQANEGLNAIAQEDLKKQANLESALISKMAAKLNQPVDQVAAKVEEKKREMHAKKVQAMPSRQIPAANKLKTKEFSRIRYFAQQKQIAEERRRQAQEARRKQAEQRAQQALIAKQKASEPNRNPFQPLQVLGDSEHCPSIARHHAGFYSANRRAVPSEKTRQANPGNSNRRPK